MDLPRGMRDFDPDELAKIERVREAFTDTARLFSFRLMDPSPIESLATLEAKSGPAIRDETYMFRDKGGREVALRFDFTVGLARYVASQRSLKLPAKLGSFGGVFRYDEPQKGRYRFFHQWNIEIFGRPGVESEAEVIEFTSSMFGRLGLQDAQIRISHRGLVESFVRRTCRVSDAQEQDRVLSDALRMIDKAAKKPRQALLAEYAHLPETAALLDFASVRGTPSEVESGADVADLEPWQHLRGLWSSLQNRSVRNVTIDLGIVRGLDYYSGTVFEVSDPDNTIGSLAGGGRYDALLGAFGRDDIGATGVAGGVERMILAMGERAGPRGARPAVSVLYVDKTVQRRAVRIASRIRSAGIPADIDLAARPLRKQMESAADSDFAVIVGPRELQRGSVILRDMSGRTERTVPVDGLESDPAAYLGRASA